MATLERIELSTPVRQTGILPLNYKALVSRVRLELTENDF